MRRSLSLLIKVEEFINLQSIRIRSWANEHAAADLARLLDSLDESFLLPFRQQSFLDAIGPREAVVLADERNFVGSEEHDGDVVVPSLLAQFLSRYSIAEYLSLHIERVIG